MAPNADKKSSFPGIWKYPSDRVDQVRTAVEWLQAKKKDDDIGSYWRVHDKLYDLTSFVQNHPGGSVWLEITQGRDITEAYEAHHPVRFNQVDLILAKYFVKDATTPRNSPYSFKQDGFYKTLKAKAEPILKEIGTGSSSKILWIQDGLAMTFIVLSLLAAYTHSISLAFLSGVILAMTLNASHNFIHMKTNWRTNYMDLTLQSSYDWRISHALSHHLYPNTVLDAEMSLVEPMFDFRSSPEKNWIQRYLSFAYAVPIFAVMLWGAYLSRWRNIIYGMQSIRPQELIVLAELFAYCFVTNSFIDGFAFWVLIHTSCSFYFGFFSFTVAHHHPTIWHDGDEPRPDPDFGLCQLDAVRERSDAIYTNLFFILTRFGEHSLHHLFPSVCHSKLSYLKPALMETLEMFKEELLAFTELQLYIGCYQQLQKIEQNPFKKLLKENMEHTKAM